MPPTYSPFWKPFEVLGRIGAARRRVDLGGPSIGTPQSQDVMGGDEWRAVASAEKLYDAWSPPAASPWSAYHKPTLFAALDNVRDPWPSGVPGLGSEAPPRTREWPDDRTALAIDLPGPMSVAYASLFALRTGHTPVVTFNNWPHPAGLVDMRGTLAALLHYAPWVQRAALARVDARTAPPAFVLDALRLGKKAPKPNDFDNRYFLLESDLPSPAVLANAGIERLFYLRADPPAGSVEPPELDDVNGWLHDLQDRVKVHLAYVALDSWTMRDPQPFAPAIRKTPFTTTTDPAFRGFRRNAAGGFGVLVPEPSSGGG